MSQPASLYFHIPFCSKKCPYCHFYVLPNRAKDQALLREGLALEWTLQASLLQGHTIESIYFGGGTPTLFGAEAIGKVMERCRDLPWAADCEVTVEANPEESTVKLFAALKAVGVNRISLGVQSLDDRSLIVLERQHSAKKAKEAIEAVHQAGISNVSIDLMYDLPSQTEASWRYTLEQLPSLPIQHLSLYNLTIEPHTSFHKRRQALTFPTADESLRFLHLGLDALEKAGLERYEISAFAKPGFASRHNLGYWTFRPFLGFGPSAFSYWAGERFQNVCHLGRYVEALTEGHPPVDYREKLPYPANLKERLAVQLRLKQGVGLPANLPEETTAAIASLQEQGLVEQKKSLLRLTERGTLFYDTIASELI
ncbi:MAG: radical SAM family heme chaperone HemW [Verrucomicrobiota bacterium]|nr:radical SAM family heme chaperone HemW [Verrucomicrobiota bacterium]